MADKVDATLANWASKADDDVDLRTEDGILESARNLSLLRKISLESALEQVREKIARRMELSEDGRVALRHTKKLQ
jgi:hypothetical protein